MTKKETQLQWLAEIYPTLEKVAQAIIVSSVTVAEDATSNAIEQILTTINKNQCKATTFGQFRGWCRMLVRGRALTACTKYNGDVRIDFGKENAIRHMRPDQRRSNPPDYDESDHEMVPFDRGETIGDEETDEV